MFIHFAITLYPDLDRQMAGIKTRGPASCYLEWDPQILHDAGYIMKYVRETGAVLVKPIHIEALSRKYRTEVVGIFLTDGAFAFRFYDTGRIVTGWLGRFHRREVLYAKERHTDGVIRGPPEPAPRPDYDLSPARPEDWTLGGLRPAEASPAS